MKTILLEAIFSLIFLSFSHLNKTTTYEDPRKWGRIEPEEVPEPRSVTLSRDPELGFGFVAGSEKSVIVRIKVISFDGGRVWAPAPTSYRPLGDRRLRLMLKRKLRGN